MSPQHDWENKVQGKKAQRFGPWAQQRLQPSVVEVPNETAQGAAPVSYYQGSGDEDFFLLVLWVFFSCILPQLISAVYSDSIYLVSNFESPKENTVLLADSCIWE